jgi:RNA polymerase sigma factor (sigma-70 family)
MASAGLGTILEHLQRVIPQRDDPSLTDAQLLDHFVAARDEQAFATLVARHGRLVLSVCRRVLRHDADAEDAFQATFLILARRAASVVRRNSVGSWLYGVAYRTALAARTTLERRRAVEQLTTNPPHPAVAPAEPQDWRPLFDRELAALPDKYRSAVVLCELEGRPRQEVARLLGVAENTLSSRLATARKLLARRLTRRGLTLPVGTLATALAADTAAAAVGPTQVMTTTGAAVGVVAGRLASTSGAAFLMQEVLKAMWLTRLKAVVAVLLVTAAVGGGGLLFRGSSARVQAAPPEEAQKASELETLRRENELLKLSLRLALEKIETQQTEIRTLKNSVDVARVQAEKARYAEDLRAATSREREKAAQALLDQARAQAQAQEAQALAEAAAKAQAQAQEARAQKDFAAWAAKKGQKSEELLLLEKMQQELKDLEQKLKSPEDPILQKLREKIEAQRKQIADRERLLQNKTPPGDIDEALRQLRAAKTEEMRQKAIDQLEMILRKLRQDKPAKPGSETPP